jgi:hypothetical protein
MRNWCRSWLWAIVVLLAVWSGRADALSSRLDEVIASGGFATANGLTFSGFEVFFTGDLAGALTAQDLLVDVIGDGFQLIGPISAADGELGDVLLTFQVSAQSEANAIVGASLLSNGVANGAGAQAGVDELILTSESGQVITVLSAFDTGGSDAPVLSAETSFAPRLSIRVAKDILVDSTLVGAGTGGSARISLIQQRFTVVPEPGGLALFAIGLSGLVAFGRRRKPAREHARRSG